MDAVSEVSWVLSLHHHLPKRKVARFLARTVISLINADVFEGPVEDTSIRAIVFPEITALPTGRAGRRCLSNIVDIGVRITRERDAGRRF